MTVAPSVYQLARNDIVGALAFVDANWGKLRPEDLTALYRLFDDPQQWQDELAQLDHYLRPLRETGAVRKLATVRKQASKYVRVVHIPDGQIRYVPIDRARARPDLYRPDGVDEAYKLKSTPPPPGVKPKPPADQPAHAQPQPPTPPPQFDEELQASVNSLARNLGVGRIPPEPSYTEKHDPDWAATQLPRSAQRAIRTHLAAILKRLGIHNYGHAAPSAHRYIIAAKMERPTLAGVHTWTGEIIVREDVHRDALAFFTNPAKASSYQAAAAGTLLHEEIHGHSPLTKEAYEKAGAFIEEATTEILCRHVVRQYLRGSFITRAYDAELVALDNTVRHALGLKSGRQASGADNLLAHKAALRAAAFMRREGIKVVSHRHDYVQLFADSLAKAVPSTAHIFKGLTPEQIAERRKQIATRTFDHIKGNFDWWVKP